MTTVLYKNPAAAGDTVVLGDDINGEIVQVTNHPLNTASTAAWTSATAVDTALSMAVSGFGIVVASFVVSGSITAGAINFEVSNDGGTTWFALLGLRAGNLNAESAYTLTGANQIWQFDVGGFTNFRVRLNPVITGTGTANIRVQAKAGDAEPIVYSDAILCGDTIIVGGIPLAVNWAQINCVLSGDNTVVNAVTGKKIRIISITLTASAAVAVAFKSGAATTIINAMSFAANGGMDSTRPHGWFMETAVTTAFIINLSAAVNVRGSCCYVLV